jgi:hypothetical protein
LARGSAEAAGLARELAVGLRLTGLRAVVNLNCAEPPTAAEDVAGGPLFAGRDAPTPEGLAALADGLADALADTPGARVDWHVGVADLAGAGRRRLLRQARRALDGAELAFVLDRPRRPAALAEGLDRAHRAALLWVGVGLGRLAEQAGAAALPDKVGSLARLALSAGAQKRAFLRRHGAAALADGFLLDRARLVVAPLGLDGVAPEPARQAVQRLREALRGPVTAAPATLDWPADAGTLVLTAEATPARLADTLEALWRAGEVVRVRLGREAPRQLTFDGRGP